MNIWKLSDIPLEIAKGGWCESIYSVLKVEIRGLMASSVFKGMTSRSLTHSLTQALTRLLIHSPIPCAKTLGLINKLQLTDTFPSTLLQRLCHFAGVPCLINVQKLFSIYSFQVYRFIWQFLRAPPNSTIALCPSSSLFLFLSVYFIISACLVFDVRPGSTIPKSLVLRERRLSYSKLQENLQR